MPEPNSIAIAQTVVKEQNKLFNFIRKRVNSTLDAEDILQDVFFQLARVSNEFNNIEKMSAWLFQVARNRITDLYRKKKSIPFSQIAQFNDDDENNVNPLESSLFDGESLPDELYDLENVNESIENCLNDLPEEQRIVFQLHEYEGLSFKEISDQLNVPINTLISRKRYAVLQLRKELQGAYDQIVTD